MRSITTNVTSAPVVESAWNKLAGEGLRELFVYTLLYSGVVVSEAAHYKPPPLLCYFPLAVTKLGFCTSEATGKQVQHKLQHGLSQWLSQGWGLKAVGFCLLYFFTVNFRMDNV